VIEHHQRGAGLQLLQPLHQEGASQGPAVATQPIGGGLQLGQGSGGEPARKGDHRLAGAAVIENHKRRGGWGGHGKYAAVPAVFPVRSVRIRAGPGRQGSADQQIRRSAAQQGPGRSPAGGPWAGLAGLLPRESPPRRPAARAERAAAGVHGLGWGFFPPYRIYLYGRF
jgi:hypothetical protein